MINLFDDIFLTGNVLLHQLHVIALVQSLSVLSQLLYLASHLADFVHKLLLL